MLSIDSIHCWLIRIVCFQPLEFVGGCKSSDSCDAYEFDASFSCFIFWVVSTVTSTIIMHNLTSTGRRTTFDSSRIAVTWDHSEGYRFSRSILRRWTFTQSQVNKLALQTPTRRATRTIFHFNIFDTTLSMEDGIISSVSCSFILITSRWPSSK